MHLIPTRAGKNLGGVTMGPQVPQLQKWPAPLYVGGP